MREWKFENGIEVYEKEFDYDLHVFGVYNGDTYLGDIIPDSIETMESIITDLNAENDPVSGCWEDGMGNTCTLNGWGKVTIQKETEETPLFLSYIY